LLEAILKDRYNNDVFTDNSTQLDLEIYEQSQSFITSPTLSKTASEGKVQFQISGTDIPGIGYFKVSSDPSLTENSFELIGQAPFDTERLIIDVMLDEDG